MLTFRTVAIRAPIVLTRFAKQNAMTRMTGTQMAEKVRPRTIDSRKVGSARTMRKVRRPTNTLGPEKLHRWKRTNPAYTRGTSTNVVSRIRAGASVRNAVRLSFFRGLFAAGGSGGSVTAGARPAGAGSDVRADMSSPHRDRGARAGRPGHRPASQ